jgi:hypothetical protein
MSGEDAFLFATAAAAALSLGLTGLFLRSFAARGRRASAASLALGNALALAASVSCALLALESYYRFTYDTTDGNNLSKLSRRWFERHWVRNQAGVRDNVEYTMERRDGRPRVTFFGDSFTAAQGVADVEDRFVNRLRRARPAWEVHAFAYNGHNTVEELAELRRRLRQGYQLDVVVLAYGFNDVDAFLPELQRLFRRVELPPRTIEPLVESSYALDLFFHRYSRRRIASGGDGVDYDAVAVRGYEGRPWEEERQLLRLFEGEVTSHGGRLAVVTFPWLRKLLEGVELRAAYDAIDAHWRERGVPHLNLLPVLREHADAGLVVNRHDHHPSVLAHALAAEAIAPFLDGVVSPAR